MRYRVEHFVPEEFFCPCCGQGRAARLLVLWLDLLRRAWGAPVRVNSGFRCTLHNREVGGAPRSRHLLGCAADVAPIGGIGAGGFFALTRRLCDFPGWELLFRDRFVHVAVPAAESEVLWEGEDILWDF